MSLFEYFVLAGLGLCILGLFMIKDALTRVEREAHVRERYLREKIRELEGKREEQRYSRPKDNQWTTKTSAKPF